MDPFRRALNVWETDTSTSFLDLKGCPKDTVADQVFSVPKLGSYEILCSGLVDAVLLHNKIFEIVIKLQRKANHIMLTLW